MGKEPGNYTLEIHQKNTHRTIKNCHCEGAPRPWQSASPVPRPPCKNPYHREPVIDSLLWQSASLVFNGPLPKEGWHSKAVTGGFFSRIPCNPSVGADASVLPNRPCPAPPVKSHVIARPVRKLVVAIRIPRPLGPLPKEGWHSKAVTGGYISVPHSLCPKMPPAAPFLSPAKEREKRTLPKPMVLDSLRGHGTGSIGALQPRE